MTTVDHFHKPLKDTLMYAAMLVRTAYTSRFNQAQVEAVIRNWMDEHDAKVAKEGEGDNGRGMLVFLTFVAPVAVVLTVRVAGLTALRTEPATDLPPERQKDWNAVAVALPLIAAGQSEEGTQVIGRRLFDSANEVESGITMAAQCIMLAAQVMGTDDAKFAGLAAVGQHRLGALAAAYYRPETS